MKIILSFLILLFSLGCATNTDSAFEMNGEIEKVKSAENITSSPPMKKRNPNCIESSKMIIDQIFKKGVIAKLCPTNFKSYYDDAFDACSSEGRDIYLELPIEKNDYVDKQKVTLSKTKCFVADGVFTHNDPIHNTFKKAIEKSFKDNYGQKINLGSPEKRIRKVKIVDAEVLVKP